MVCLFVCLLCQSGSISGTYVRGEKRQKEKERRREVLRPQANFGNGSSFKQPFQPIGTTARLKYIRHPYLKNELKIFSKSKWNIRNFASLLMAYFKACVCVCVRVYNLFTCKLFERVNWKIITFFDMGHGSISTATQWCNKHFHSKVILSFIYT